MPIAEMAIKRMLTDKGRKFPNRSNLEPTNKQLIVERPIEVMIALFKPSADIPMLFPKTKLYAHTHVLNDKQRNIEAGSRNLNRISLARFNSASVFSLAFSGAVLSCGKNIKAGIEMIVSITKAKYKSRIAAPAIIMGAA